MGIWDAVKDVFQQALQLIHSGLEPIFGQHAWGWAIIALTVLVRVLLLPLAVKQTRSMRAMQLLQPRIKQLQKKYKVDRDLMRKDPETYKNRKQKLNEEMMALYKEEGVNPASGCLPLLLQAPIFLALFHVLRDYEPLTNAKFYFFTANVSEDATAHGLGALVNQVGWPGWLLIVLMSATMFWSQRQMMARNAGQVEGTAQQQQKIMMYVMPVFLAFVSFNFPLGVLLYWVTTNLWQMGQQAVILREVKHDVEEATAAAIESKRGKRSTPRADAGTDVAPVDDATPTKPKAKTDKRSPSPNGETTAKRKRDHLPKRGDAANR